MTDSKSKRQPRGRNLATIYCPGEHAHIEEEIMDFVDDDKNESYSSVMMQCILEGWKVLEKKHKKSSKK